MNQNYTALINIAKNYLCVTPIDILHDFAHHQAVHQNCLDIIEYECLRPDHRLLEVCAWWHDVERNDGSPNSADDTIQTFAKVAGNLQIDTDFIHRCQAIISEHSYGETPV